MNGDHPRSLRPGRAGADQGGSASRTRLRKIRDIACRRAREAGYDAHPDFYLLVAQFEVGCRPEGFPAKGPSSAGNDPGPEEEASWLEKREPGRSSLLDPIRRLVARKLKDALKMFSRLPSPGSGSHKGFGSGRHMGRG